MRLDLEGAVATGKERLKLLGAYLVVTYAILVANASSYLTAGHFAGLLASLFSISALLTHALACMLPFALSVLLVHLLFGFAVGEGAPSRMRSACVWIPVGASVVLFAAMQGIVHVDSTVFRLFDFHLNGFVWNLIATHGGIASLDGGGSTVATLLQRMAGFLVIQTLALIAIMRMRRLRKTLESCWIRRGFVWVGTAFIALGIFEAGVHGLSAFAGDSTIPTLAQAFPVYPSATFNQAAKRLGFKPKMEPEFRLRADSGGLRYPLNPIQRNTDHPLYNIVWLVAESFRPDMIDPEIMPHTHAFAQKATWFQNHYSGSNGTRMGLFSMFYGLYGNYWFGFLRDRRGPVLMDVLLEDNYQMSMYTSANFTYPEFDKTLFARIPKAQLHEQIRGQRWERDRENVTELLHFIENRDPTRAFMTFMFFESPHARYAFPPENAIRTPYLEDLNYGALNLRRDIPLIKNRYVNACNHLDGQFGRILEFLERQGLLANTIVLITGDHGEEFMEKGRWGHNSSFVEEQIRTPLILWIPGRGVARISSITSHLDIPATLLPLMGVTNAPDEYGLGLDLLGPVNRPCAVISDWGKVAYVDHEYKAVFVVKDRMAVRPTVTTRDDLAVEDRSAFYRSRRVLLNNIMYGLARFGNAAGSSKAF
jgi:uncharacterized protein